MREKYIGAYVRVCRYYKQSISHRISPVGGPLGYSVRSHLVRPGSVQQYSRDLELILPEDVGGVAGK